MKYDFMKAKQVIKEIVIKSIDDVIAEIGLKEIIKEKAKSSQSRLDSQIEVEIKKLVDKQQNIVKEQIKRINQLHSKLLISLADEIKYQKNLYKERRVEMSKYYKDFNRVCRYLNSLGYKHIFRL